MSNISTEDCKDFLTKKFSNSKRALWKRERKYKNDAGDWCRDFSNPDVGNVSLVEVNGVLSFFKKNAANKLASANVNAPAVTLGTHEIFLKTFSEDDRSNAANIVSNYMDDYHPPRPTEDGFFAIPSQFTYSFSSEEGEDDDEMEYANSNLDINAKFTQFVIYISPNDYPDYDQHLHSLLSPFFSRNFGEEMECVFGFYYDRPTSIKEFVTMMAKQGFKYDSHNDQCLLKDVMETFTYLEGATFEEATKHKIAETSVEKEVIVPAKSTIKRQLESTPELFCSLVKNDNAQALDEAITDGLDLGLLINRISLHSYCVNNDLPECFKVLVKHTPNMAVDEKGEANTVWRDAILFGKDCTFNYSQYLLDNANYDFSKETYRANAAFVYFLHSIGQLESKFEKLNEMYAACICYANSIANKEFYESEFVKSQVRKAIFNYADFSNVDTNIAIALTNDVIIPEVLDMMIEKGDVCIVGKPLREYITLVVDRFKHGFWGYDQIESKENIQYYENVLRKLGGI